LIAFKAGRTSPQLTFAASTIVIVQNGQTSFTLLALAALALHSGILQQNNCLTVAYLAANSLNVLHIPSNSLFLFFNSLPFLEIP
jgi:hypothetical protein